MRVFTYMWSTLFLLNAGLVGSITWIALAGWNNGTDVDARRWRRRSRSSSRS